MNEENRQIVERLAEAVDSQSATLERLVEAVSGPDWWVIAITIVNAVIMAWLGWRQYLLQRQQTKLQEQQVRQQEYEIYRQVYSLVKKADREISSFLDVISESLGVIPHIRADGDFLQIKYKDIKLIISDIQENSINYEIKFSRDFFDFQGYNYILSRMTFILKYFEELVQKDIVTFSNSLSIKSIDGDMDKGTVYYIIKHIKDVRHREVLGSYLLDFIEAKRKLNNNGTELLEKIRKHCKID